MTQPKYGAISAWFKAKQETQTAAGASKLDRAKIKNTQVKLPPLGFGGNRFGVFLKIEFRPPLALSKACPNRTTKWGYRGNQLAANLFHPPPAGGYFPSSNDS